MHEHARGVRAHLPGGIEVGEQRARHRVVQLGVLEDDQRRLAAQFERHALERLRRVAHHRLAGADLAGQRYFANIGMASEQTAGIGEALHHLEHARRQSGLDQDLLELHGGERGEFRRLEDHGIAAGQCGRRLPAGDLQRVVPCADAGDHAERLAARVAEGLRAEIDVLAAQGLRKARKIFEAIRAGNHVHDQRLLDGLAGIARFELGKLLIARAQQLGGAAQHARALRARHRSPSDLAVLRRTHRGVDLRRTRSAHVAEHLSGRRIDGSEALAGRGNGGAGTRRGGRVRALLGARPRRRGAAGIEPSVDEFGEQCARAAAVRLAPSRQGRAQPHAVDHRGDHRGQDLRFLGRHELLE